jgi:4-hydroxy-tetrahydrodipicolinate reductase
VNTVAKNVRVAVFGAGGRMGAEVCRAVAAADGLELVAGVDPYQAGKDLSEFTRATVGVDAIASMCSTPSDLATAKPDVAIDFTVHGAAMENLRWCAANGVHAVVGTTGFSEADLAELRAGFTKSNCLIAANFAIGAVLMMRFAELAAPFFETAEVIEYHHDGKVDAPSGTAVTTANRMAAAKSTWAPDPTTKEVIPGSRGGRGPADIRVHAVRMRGVVANQEVILGTTGQTLVIRHDTTDRTSFMPGIVLAAQRIADYPGLTIGLDSFLGL